MIISVIACPNGLGHFYRLLEILKVIAKKYYLFFLFKKSVKKIDSKFKNISLFP